MKLTAPVDANGNLIAYPQTLYPDHCIQAQSGAQLIDEVQDLVKLHKDMPIQQKGTKKKIDSYSAFEDAGNRGTGDKAVHPTGQLNFDGILRDNKIKTVISIGVALDGCVRFTAIDAERYDFRSYVIPELTRGFDPNFPMDTIFKKYKIGCISLDDYSKALDAVLSNM